jgi:hypothetical protein
VAERGWPLEGGYRIELFAEQDAVGPEDIVALWRTEEALPEQEARRRVGEVLLVATDADGRAAGISTMYLQRNEQLRMVLWHVRAFTARAHRKSTIAVSLALIGRDHMREQYVSGRDTRAGGLLYEVENEGLKTYFDDALWQPADFLFIGESPTGAHVRVHYFPGALAPEPDET